jgi:hypothetical protein
MSLPVILPTGTSFWQLRHAPVRPSCGPLRDLVVPTANGRLWSSSRQGVKSWPGAARTILLFHVISARPSKQSCMVGSTLGVYSFGLIFVSARTNKRHHHLQGYQSPRAPSFPLGDWRGLLPGYPSPRAPQQIPHGYWRGGFRRHAETAGVTLRQGGLMACPRVHLTLGYSRPRAPQQIP